MRCLLHSITGCLREHKPSAPCSVLLSNNFVIIKACSKSMGSTNLAYSKNVNLKVSVRLSFQGFPLFLHTEKLAKCSCFVTGCCLIHPPLIFATKSLTIPLQHIIKLCISLISQNLNSWYYLMS